MDINEFLDREVTDLGLLTDAPEKTEDFGIFPNLNSAKNGSDKGKLEQTEQAYNQLWNNLTQQKLKWNKELYDKIFELSKQISGILNNSYAEVKKKLNQINDTVNKGRAFLREGKKDESFKLYSEAANINNSISNIYFEEKKTAQDQIMDFYKELKNTTDNELMKKVSALIQEINQLLDGAIRCIRANDMANAILMYNKCIGLYNQMPEGFLKYKYSMGVRLLDIYKSISIYSEISSLQQQLTKQTQQFQQQAEYQNPQAAPRLAQREIQQKSQEQLQQNSKQEPQKQSVQLSATKPTAQLFAQTNPKADSLALNSSTALLLRAKKDLAKINIAEGQYKEAFKAVQEALQLAPNDPEAKAMYAKFKTLK